MVGHGFTQRHRQTQQHKQTLNQKQVLGLKVLELSQPELDAGVEMLAEQGILDAIPSELEAQSGTLRNADDQDDAASEDLPEQATDPTYEHETQEFFPETKQCQESSGAPAFDGEASSPEDYLTAPIGLREHLLAQLDQFHLVEQQRCLALFIVEGLDSRGFFSDDLEESALACGSSVDDFRVVLARVQECEPVGVAARNAWDAIRLVLERSERQETLEWRITSLMTELAEAGQLPVITGLCSMVSKTDCEQVAARLCKIIVSRLGVDECQARQALVRLLATVPHPVDQHEEEFTPWGDHHLQSVEERAPDVAIISVSNGRFVAELSGSRYASFSVSRALVARIEEINSESKALSTPKDLLSVKADMERKTNRVCLTIEREQKEECREHALRFIQAWADRRTTLLRVTEVLVHRQAAYLRSGSVFDLKCLSVEEVATELGREEFGGLALSGSTVDRALQGKLVRLSNGKVEPLKMLCSPGEKAKNTDGEEVRYLPEIVKEWIKEYIRQEAPANPLSDEQICRKVAHEEDLVLSRKTIENYRKELSIPSARERKRRPGAC